MSDFGEQFLIDVILNGNQFDPWNRTVNFDRWKPAVLDQLRKIAGSNTGLILLKAIRNTGIFCAIVPPSPEVSQACNSQNNGLAHPGVDVASPSKGRHYRAVIEFDPSQYQSGSLCYRNKHRGDPNLNRGSLPNEILFHELFHAVRTLKGTRQGTKLSGGLALYGNLEEFLAVMVTNIYISELSKHGSGLRSDHTSHRPLSQDLNSSLAFFKSSPQVLPILQKFVVDCRQFCEELCNVKTAFNPIAAVMDKSLAPLLVKLGQTNVAKERELLVPLIKPLVDRLRPEPPPMQPVDAAKAFAEDLAKEALKWLPSE